VLVDFYYITAAEIQAICTHIDTEVSIRGVKINQATAATDRAKQPPTVPATNIEIVENRLP